MATKKTFSPCSRCSVSIWVLIGSSIIALQLSTKSLTLTSRATSSVVVDMSRSQLWNIKDITESETSLRTSQTTSTKAESYVISFHHTKIHQFEQRNNHTNLGPSLWVPAVDGRHQRNLNMWADMIYQPPLNASDTNKEGYKTPHAVGCYLAHWNLLKMLKYRRPELRPDLYFVFEDDASCIPDLRERVFNITRQLPKEWDLLYIGGKHFTYFNEGRTLRNSSNHTLHQEACRGAFGGAEGPLAPDGTRNLSRSQPYWRTMYVTNTGAYVVNPGRVDRILDLIQPKEYIPIDILLANLIIEGKLLAFMPTMEYCHQYNPSDGPKMEPTDWEGYFYLRPQSGGRHPLFTPKYPDYYYRWDKLFIKECPGVF